MSILGGEQLTEQIIVTITRLGVSITGSLLHATQRSLLQALRLTGKALTHLPGAPTSTPTGKMSIRKLQHLAGGDLHAQQVTPELVATMKRQLKRRGVDFSIEKAPDGLTYFHFKGADVDTVRHALSQAAAAIAAKHGIDTSEEAARNDHAHDLPTPDNPPHSTSQETDGIVLGEDTEWMDRQGVSLVWESANDADLGDLAQDALPTPMQDLLGSHSRARVNDLLDQAVHNGWSVEQIHQRLSTQPLPDPAAMTNPPGLVITRVQDVATSTPPQQITPSHTQPATRTSTPVTGKDVLERLNKKIETKQAQSPAPAPAPARSRSPRR